MKNLNPLYEYKKVTRDIISKMHLPDKYAIDVARRKLSRATTSAAKNKAKAELGNAMAKEGFFRKGRKVGKSGNGSKLSISTIFGKQDIG